MEKISSLILMAVSIKIFSTHTHTHKMNNSFLLKLMSFTFLNIFLKYHFLFKFYNLCRTFSIKLLQAKFSIPQTFMESDDVNPFPFSLGWWTVSLGVVFSVLSVGHSAKVTNERPLHFPGISQEKCATGSKLVDSKILLISHLRKQSVEKN